MPEQIHFPLDNDLNMVVSYDILYGEDETYDTPASPDQLLIHSIKLWEKQGDKYESVDITNADASLLDFNLELIEEEIWKQYENR